MKATAAVLAHLERRGVAAALIGGVALGFHGVARATLDSDILVSNPAVLDVDFWNGLGALPPPEIRRGDDDDPLAGLVRFDSPDVAIDVVVIAGVWIGEILDRRVRTVVEGHSLAIVDRADLVVLKLYAGGPQDLLDVRLLLEADAGLRPQVEARLARAPRPARNAWNSLALP